MNGDQPPFAVDVKWADQSGTEYMAHVRAEDIATFNTRFAELAGTFPALRARRPLPLHVPVEDDPTPPAEWEPEPDVPPEPVPTGREPLCPTHGKSKPSNYGGYYCPAPNDTGDGYCAWKWGNGKPKKGRTS